MSAQAHLSKPFILMNTEGNYVKLLEDRVGSPTHIVYTNIIKESVNGYD